MEQAPRNHKASKSACDDIISKMPENVTTHILDHLPIQDALRTSILSRNWRFKWTLLSKVVFDKKFFEYLQGIVGVDRYFERNIISSLLLLLKGPITMFYLYIPKENVLDVKDINHWVMFLSKKEIKELYLTNMRVTPLKLSTHLFSCVELKHLVMRNCYLYPPTTFCGFPKLLSLGLYEVEFMNRNFGEIITQCPLLEFLEVSYPYGKVKMVEITKLTNLNLLSFPLCKFDDIWITSSLVFHLLCHFPKLEELYLDLRMCKFLEESGSTNCVSSSFHCLRLLMLYPIDFNSDVQLSFAFDMIWGLPELHTLMITAVYNDGVRPYTLCSSALNHISNGQLQLQSVVFKSFRGSENEICLIKKLLACSPALNKFDIYPSRSLMCGGNDRKLMLTKKLLKLRRASSAAEANIYWS